MSEIDLKVCDKCNCDFFDRCSIVDYMPIGFCCEKCLLYNEFTTCLNLKTLSKEEVEKKTENVGEIKLISTTIEGEFLKVIIEHKDEKEKTLFIDLKKYLES